MTRENQKAWYVSPTLPRQNVMDAVPDCNQGQNVEKPYCTKMPQGLGCTIPGQGLNDHIYCTKHKIPLRVQLARISPSASPCSCVPRSCRVCVASLQQPLLLLKLRPLLLLSAPPAHNKARATIKISCTLANSSLSNLVYITLSHYPMYADAENTSRLWCACDAAHEQEPSCR